jgi:hypothetical protein
VPDPKLPPNPTAESAPVRVRDAIAVERENFRNLFRQTPEMVCMRLRKPYNVIEFLGKIEETLR